MRTERQFQKNIEAEWRLYPTDTEKRSALADSLAIPEPIAQILQNRGINTAEEGKAFLNPNLSQLLSPYDLLDMDLAVEIIAQALRKQKKIAVYGDYDADGITATALLVSLLRDLGGDVTFYIPGRLEEGYSLKKTALEHLKRKGVSLIVTVDCGVASLEEVSYARKLGLDVVITDHHQPRSDLPVAGAIVNPHRSDCSYPFKSLCGAGIAYKLADALLRNLHPDHNDKIEDYLDLAAIGTVADVVPLLGENRVLVHCGLQKMRSNLRPGLKALCQVAGLDYEQLSAQQIAFIIAPRLNAPGRLGDAYPALSLLLEQDYETALEIAEGLQQKNTRRQGIEGEIFTEACRLMEESYTGEERLLLLAAERWNPGVLGIVAGRMAEKYNLPVILLSLTEETGKGSGRSAGDFDITAALKECASMLLEYGGHKSACGLSLKRENLLPLKEKLNQLAGDYSQSEKSLPQISVELNLVPGMITPRLVESLELLEPFGYGNPRPLFASEDWTLSGVKEVGRGGRHLQLSLQTNNVFWRGISFNGREKLPVSLLNRKIDLLFSLSFDRWRGDNNLQIEVFALKYREENRKNNLTVFDLRETGEKRELLNQLLSSKDEALVFVNTARCLQELEKSYSGRQGISFTHQGRLPKDHPAEIRRLILYDLPLSGDRLRELYCFLQESRQERGIISVYLLYGVKDFQENLKLLRATLPSISVLEQIYFYIQEINGEKGVLPVDLSIQLKKSLPFPVTVSLLEKSLEIFQEAAYLRREKEYYAIRTEMGKGGCLLLKNLSLTATFCMEKTKREQIWGWQQFFLSAAGERILSFFEGR